MKSPPNLAKAEWARSIARATRDLNREVAIKVLSSGLTSSELARERFQREALTIAALHHPHICAIYDVETPNHQAFIVMEFLQGETLEERLRKGPLDLPIVMETAIALADALAAAHAAGIVHRDIKPANVFLTAWGPKLLDFGVANSAASRDCELRHPNRRRTANVDRRRGYRRHARLHVAGAATQQRQVNARTDVFSLGLVLFQMATGRPAFAGATAPVVAAAILHEQPPAPSTLRAGLTTRLDELILKALKEWDITLLDPADLRSRPAAAEAGYRRSRDCGRRSRGGRTHAARHAVRAAAALLAIAAIGGGYVHIVVPAPPSAAHRKRNRGPRRLRKHHWRSGVRRHSATRAGDSAPAVNVPQPLTSDTRIQQLLRLMGQPADATLTPAIARDICERMGGGAILEGSIASLGAQYVIGVRASGCRSGAVLGEEQAQIAKKEDVLNALSDIASRLETPLGDGATAR